MGAPFNTCYRNDTVCLLAERTFAADQHPGQQPLTHSRLLASLEGTWDKGLRRRGSWCEHASHILAFGRGACTKDPTPIGPGTSMLCARTKADQAATPHIIYQSSTLSLAATPPHSAIYHVVNETWICAGGYREYTSTRDILRTLVICTAFSRALTATRQIQGGQEHLLMSDMVSTTGSTGKLSHFVTQSTLNSKGLPRTSSPEGKRANDGKAWAVCVPGLSQPTTTLTALALLAPPPSPWWMYSARKITTSPAVSAVAFCEATVTSGRDAGWIKSEEDVDEVSMTNVSRIQSLLSFVVGRRGAERGRAEAAGMKYIAIRRRCCVCRVAFVGDVLHISNRKR